MASFIHLLCVISFLACAVLAEDVSNTKSDSTDEKWLYGGRYRNWFGSGWYGTGMVGGGLYPWLGNYGTYGGVGYFPYTYSRTWFSKEVGASSTARRSHLLNLEQHYRRQSTPVTCKEQDGRIVEFIPQECLKAASLLVSRKASQQACGKCSLKLVSPEGPIAANGIPSDVLVKATEKILQSCAASAHDAPSPAQNEPGHPGRRSPADTSNNQNGQQIALLIQPGQGAPC